MVKDFKSQLACLQCRPVTHCDHLMHNETKRYDTNMPLNCWETEIVSRGRIGRDFTFKTRTQLATAAQSLTACCQKEGWCNIVVNRPLSSPNTYLPSNKLFCFFLKKGGGGAKSWLLTFHVCFCSHFCWLVASFFVLHLLRNEKQDHLWWTCLHEGLNLKTSVTWTELLYQTSRFIMMNSDNPFHFH